MNNTLIGIVTRNDFQNYKKLQDSITSCYDLGGFTFLVINDGQSYSSNEYAFQYIQNPRTKNNAGCYNIILRKAVNESFDHVFIVHDNIELLDGGVFSKYQETAYETGIPMFNFGLSATPTPPKGELKSNSRAIINYTETCGITLNADTTSAFNYLHSSVVEKVGYYDERYKSVMESADYMYRAVEAGYAAPWGWFADIANAEKFLKIHKSNDTQDGLRARIMHAAGLFKHKFQLLPEQLPNPPIESVKTELKLLKSKNLLPKVVEAGNPQLART